MICLDTGGISLECCLSFFDGNITDWLIVDLGMGTGSSG